QLGFLDKPFKRPLEAALELGASYADGGLILAIGDVAREKLLDRHLAIEVAVHCQIGIAEPARAEHANDVVVPNKRAAGCQCIDHPRHNVQTPEVIARPSISELSPARIRMILEPIRPVLIAQQAYIWGGSKAIDAKRRVSSRLASAGTDRPCCHPRPLHCSVIHYTVSRPDFCDSPRREERSCGAEVEPRVTYLLKMS